jgi:hypothetical protein
VCGCVGFYGTLAASGSLKGVNKNPEKFRKMIG